MNYDVIIVIIGHRGHSVLNIREGETGFLRQFLHHCRDLVKTRRSASTSAIASLEADLRPRFLAKNK